jgi:hypothetical protein
MELTDNRLYSVYYKSVGLASEYPNVNAGTNWWMGYWSSSNVRLNSISGSFTSLTSARDHGFIEVEPPKDAGAIIIFPGPDGKVDMIDAVEVLYGIRENPGDRVIRIRGGRIVSDEEVV